MNIPDKQELTPNHCREVYIKANYHEFWAFLNERYSFLETFQERMYWYYNGVKERPVCANCKGPIKFIRFTTGYQEYCCVKCSNNSAKKKEDIKNTNNAKFGGNAPACSKEVLDKMKNSCIERYGAENAMQNNDVKLRTRDTHLERYGGQGNASNVLLEKQQKTCIERYGVENAMQSSVVQDKVKNTNLQKYGCVYASQCEDIKYKVANTKRQNKSFNTSSIEEQFARYLDSTNTTYIRQYNSALYHFNCDFYVPKYDLYVEINAMWTHNTHPFNANSPKDIQELEKWKNKKSAFYNNAITVWTISDPKKQECAKNNCLNYLCSYSTKINELIKEYEAKIHGNT